MNKIYETNRLYVTPFTKEHMNDNYQSWFHDEDVTKHNAHGLFPYTKGQMETFLSRLESSDDIVWAVMAKVLWYNHVTKKDEMHDNHEHIGNISLQNINWINRSAEFACVFGNKDYWNKGYCTEAAKLLFAHGFDKLNLHRIFTGTGSTNLGMQKVAGKLGMILEGTFIDGTYLNGEYVDILMFGITKEMWKKYNK